MRKLLAHCRENTDERIALITRMSFVLNILIGIGKLVLGIYLLSSWFVVNAFYYSELVSVINTAPQRKTQVAKLNADIVSTASNGSEAITRIFNKDK